MKIHIPTPLRAFTEKQETVSVVGTTVAVGLEQLVQQYPAMRAHLYTPEGKLRSFVGKQLGIRLTPSLEFIADAIPETAAHLEDLLREARERDAAVAAAAAGAVHAGEADPYKKDRELDEHEADPGDEGHEVAGAEA